MRARYGILAGAALFVTLGLVVLGLSITLPRPAAIAPTAPVVSSPLMATTPPAATAAPSATAPATAQAPSPSVPPATETYTPVPSSTPALPLPTETATPVPSATPSPAPTHPPAPTVEARALWITRFDWTCAVDDPAHPCPGGRVPGPDDLRAMVANADAAGFNTLLFQIRGNGDAYYTPGLEPWSARLTGTFSNTLGLDPGWDPLAVMLDEAHARGLQVHAYFNTFPTWLGAGPPPRDTVPLHPYWQWSGADGSDQSWRVWGNDHVPMQFSEGYVWASPGNEAVQAHLVNTAADLLRRYPVDGLHLDLTRYPGSGYSCDPRSEARWGAPCPDPIRGSAYADQQRAWVTDLVRRMRDEVVVPEGRQVALSAAVWWYPHDTFGLGCTPGYEANYQDSYGWLAQGIVDAEFPMLYGCSAFGAEGDDAWSTVMREWLDHRATGSIFPGIQVDEMSWDSIVRRIDAERAYAAATGAVPGHAIFSYSYMAAYDYWDDFANGPYAVPATAPVVAGHP